MSTDTTYKMFVKQLADSRENRTFLNSDEDHALDVLVQIFQHAVATLRIFAGELCDSVGDRQEYIVALSEFIERGGAVYILLNRFKEDDARTSNLFKRLAYYQSLGKPVHVKTTSVHPYRMVKGQKQEAHLTIGDDRAYRIETDIVERRAECNMNNPEIASNLIRFYDRLFEDDKAVNVELEKLFANAD